MINGPTRPPAPFQSTAVERAVAKLCDTIRDEELRETFRLTAMNTLETTIIHGGTSEFPDTYIITGDIPAMWLRDSAAQVLPYLRFLREDLDLSTLVRGLVRRHCQCILLDPYANAFTYSAAERSEHADDLTTMKPGVFERKYEVDSLCSTVHLVYRYWQVTADVSVLDEECLRAMRRIIQFWRIEQNHEQQSGYRFMRQNCPESDTLPHEGRGTPVAFTRMTWSGFRPSDDRCELHFHVPSQAFAVVSLRQLSQLATAINDTELVEEATALAADIEAGIQEFGIRELQEGSGPVYGYEVDGLGNCIFMDDANVPSLLSLPLIGYCHASEPLYQATRRYVLSTANPYYVKGEFAAGVGSPHTPAGRVWPISIIVQALTTSDAAEIHHCLQQLLVLHAGSRLMHESVDPDNPHTYSRAWFAWANSLFAELIFQLAETHPEILVDFSFDRASEA